MRKAPDIILTAANICMCTCIQMAGRQASTGILNRVFAGSPASVMGVQCESGLIASSVGCWWQADAFADGTLEHNTPKQNNWGVNCSAGAAVEAR